MEYHFRVVNDGLTVAVLNANGLIDAIKDGVLKEGDSIKVEEIA